MATPFRFRLDRVRDVRVREEDLAREALSGALRARDSSVDVVDGLTGRLRAVQVVPAADTPTGGADLVARQRWVQSLEGQVAAARGELRRHDATVSTRRLELTDAGRRRQALDRLRERRAAEHHLAEGRREAAELDEMALLRRVVA